MAIDRSYVKQNAAEHQRLQALVERLSDAELAWINDSAKALCLALPARAAAGTPLNLLRATHRRQHLDEIERSLRR